VNGESVSLFAVHLPQQREGDFSQSKTHDVTAKATANGKQAITRAKNLITSSWAPDFTLQVPFLPTSSLLFVPCLGNSLASSAGRVVRPSSGHPVGGLVARLCPERWSVDGVVPRGKFRRLVARARSGK
jgi:hypothetical protein